MHYLAPHVYVHSISNHRWRILPTICFSDFQVFDFEVLSFTVIHPLLQTPDGHHYILPVSDSFEHSSTWYSYHHYNYRHGCPIALICNPGINFQCDMFLHLLRLIPIQQRKISSFTIYRWINALNWCTKNLETFSTDYSMVQNLLFEFSYPYLDNKQTSPARNWLRKYCLVETRTLFCFVR